MRVVGPVGDSPRAKSSRFGWHPERRWLPATAAASREVPPPRRPSSRCTGRPCRRRLSIGREGTRPCSRRRPRRPVRCGSTGCIPCKTDRGSSRNPARSSCFPSGDPLAGGFFRVEPPGRPPEVAGRLVAARRTEQGGLAGHDHRRGGSSSRAPRGLQARARGLPRLPMPSTRQPQYQPPLRGIKRRASERGA